MRSARRLTAIIIGCATWTVLATTYAYAGMLHDPVPLGPTDVTRTTGASGTPLWEQVTATTLGVLLVLAVVGLVSSLRHSRRSEHPTTRLTT